MGRFMIMMMAGGAFVAYLGWQEMSLSQGATEAPLEISLSELEAGSVPENPHLVIGEHWALHHELVFSYRAERGQEDAEPTPEQKLDYVYYPIVAPDNRYIREWTNLEKLYGDAEIPEAQLPAPAEFTVLVRSETYQTYGSLPDPGWAEAASVQGMVVNEVRSLTSDEEALIGQSFPHVTLSDVLILEQGRKPASATKSYAMMGGGAFVAVLPLLAMARRREESGPAVPMGHETGDGSFEMGGAPDDRNGPQA